MRHNRAFQTVLLAVALVMVASVALAVAEGTAAPGTSDKAPVGTKKVEAEAATEEAKPVTATLTYIKNGTQTKEVPYLPEGRKIATLETTKGIVKIELWDDNIHTPELCAGINAAPGVSAALSPEQGCNRKTVEIWRIPPTTA